MLLQHRGLLAASIMSVVLAGCGGGSTGEPSGSTSTSASAPAPGALLSPAFRIASLSASAFQSSLAASASGQSLLQVAGAPSCGVDFYYVQYGTVGGKGEATTASGAVMVPTGSSAQCSGARPIVLYAHGTTTDKNYNIADITNPNNTEGALVAAMFAAQGYIVVATNYAGYDTSTLSYHPYLNGAEQSADMLNMLTAARSSLPEPLTPGTTYSNKLFVTGYSQGGYVAMATLKAMQAAGTPPTAVVGMSGPYTLAALGDAIFLGNVNLGSTEFTPLLASSYQHAYGNVYTNLTDIFTPQYATGIDTLLPSTTPIATIFADGLLPETQLFSSTPPAAPFASITPPTQPAALAPLFAIEFGPNPLVQNSYRLSYLEDEIANPDEAVNAANTPTAPFAPNPAATVGLRKDFVTNDLRSFIPEVPVMMCGGQNDPTVFWFDSEYEEAYWQASGANMALVTLLNIDSAVTMNDSPAVAALKQGFAAAVNAELQSGGQFGVVENYHGTLVPPFCTAAARAYFSNF